MRIISGTHKGRQIKPPSNFRARPTTDQAREGLFNILSNQFDFEELVVADLFGGTGAISYEFLSRGVIEVFTVEKSPVHLKFIRSTIKELGFSNINTFRHDALKAINRLPKEKFDIIFADPPFNMPDKDKLIEKVFENKVLKNGTFILEHSDRESFSKSKFFKEQRNYGKVCFSFFEEI